MKHPQYVNFKCLSAIFAAGSIRGLFNCLFTLLDFPVCFHLGHGAT